MNRKKFYKLYRYQFESRLSQATVDAIESLLDTFEKYNASVEHAAYILATVRHEVGYRMQTITENMRYTTAKRLIQVWPSRFNYSNAYSYVNNPEKLANNVYANRLGNTKPCDGFRYRGRGFIQITGKSNYKRFSELLDVDLINNPHLANQNNIAASIAVYGCLNGLFTGKKLSDYINKNKKNFVNARKVVNADVKRVGRSIARNAKKFLAILKQC